MVNRDTLQRSLMILTLLLFAVPVVSGQSATALRVIACSSAGTTVNIIDPATNKVVGVIHDIEINRSAAAFPDGSRLYIVGQTEREIVVVDAKTFQILERVPVNGRPDYVAATKDGRRFYVGLGGPASIGVYDATSLQLVKTIPVEGSVHYAYLTPDDTYIVTASVGGRTMNVISTRTEEQEWMMTFDRGVRPIGFETGPDGSTERLFVELTDLHGFAVVDFATRKEITRITFPDIPGKMKNVEGVQGAPAHGIEITPDGKTLWATSKWYGYAYAYSLPDLKLVGQVEVGALPEWISFTPDGTSMYISLAGADKVAVVDPEQKKLVTTIPVGYSPKFNIIAKLQVN